METIINTIIYLVLGFIGGYSCRVLFDRRTDESALQGVRQARDITKAIEAGNKDMSGTVSDIKEGIKRAETATGEMEEELDRIEQGNQLVSTAVERAERAASEAEHALERAEGSVGSIRKILSQAKKKE